MSTAVSADPAAADPLGTNTDPYQPIERKLQITRQLLEVFQRYKHPLTVITKSAMIERDIDILSELAKHNLVQVALSVTFVFGENAVLIAHYYTQDAVQDLAEETGGMVGDSLEMARFGKEHPGRTLIVAGVKFMGESAKILTPEKRVLMPTLEATCSRSEERFSRNAETGV